MAVFARGHGAFCLLVSL